MHKKLAASLALLFASSVGAQQGAHEHGIADLRIAIDGSTVVIEFDSPLDNLVGFEHAPRTQAQRDALAEAEARLKQFDGLFVPSAAAGCVLAEMQFESPYPQTVQAGDHQHDHGPGHSHGDHSHDDHSHDDHSHDDRSHDDHGHDDHGHDEHDHDEHDHADGSDNGHDRAHVDMYAVYQLECANPGALNEIHVGLIEAFPRLHTLRAETATPEGQGSVRLDKANTRLGL